MREAEVFAALLARVDAAQLCVWSARLLHEQLQHVQAALNDALVVMQRLQEVQTDITKLEREQAVIGIHSGRTDGVMALVDVTQCLNERMLSALARFSAPQQGAIRPEGGRILQHSASTEDQPEIQNITRVEEQSSAVESVLPLRVESKYDASMTTQRVNSQRTDGNDRMIPNIVAAGDDVDGRAVEVAALPLRAECKDDEPAPAMRVHRKRSRKEIAATVLRIPATFPTAQQEEKRYPTLQKNESVGIKAEPLEPSSTLPMVPEAEMRSESKSESELDAQPKTAPRQQREHVQVNAELKMTAIRQRRQPVPADEEKPSRPDEEEEDQENTEEPVQPSVQLKREQIKSRMSAVQQILTFPEQQHQHRHVTNQLSIDKPVRSQAEQENLEEASLAVTGKPVQPTPEQEKEHDKESLWYYITGPGTGTIVPVGSLAKKDQHKDASQQSADYEPMPPSSERDQDHDEASVAEDEAMEPESESELEQGRASSQVLSDDELIRLMHEHDHRQDQEEAQLSAEESMQSESEPEQEQDQEDSSQTTTEESAMRSLPKRDQQEDDAGEYVRLTSQQEQELEQDQEDSQAILEEEPAQALPEQQQERQERSQLTADEPMTTQEQCEEESEPSPMSKAQSSSAQAHGEGDGSRIIGLALAKVQLGTEGPTQPVQDQMRCQEEVQSVVDEPMPLRPTQDRLQHQEEYKVGPEATTQPVLEQAPAQEQAREVIADIPLDVAADFYKPIAFPFANEVVEESKSAEEDTTAIPPAIIEQQGPTEVAQRRPEEPQPIEPSIQWSLLTEACYSGANQFEAFPPELKNDRLNWVLQPLQILFDKVIQNSESANRELVTRDHARVELAVLAFTDCVTGQPIPPYRLNGYRFFLKSMDGAITCVEQLGSRLAEYREKLEAAMTGKLGAKTPVATATTTSKVIETVTPVATPKRQQAPVGRSKIQQPAISKLQKASRNSAARAEPAATVLKKQPAPSHTATTNLTGSHNQQREQTKREKTAAKTREFWEGILRKCRLTDEELDKLYPADQLEYVRFCYSGIHQFFEHMFKTESCAGQRVPSEYLDAFITCVRSAVNRMPNLPLPRKNAKQMVTKIAKKILKAMSCSGRLRLAFDR